MGIAQGALDKALAYAKERQQFGQPIANFQAIQWMLADMATKIDAARLLTQRAAYLKDNGLPFIKEAAIVEDVYKAVKALVPESVWSALEARRQEFQRSYQEPHA